MQELESTFDIVKFYNEVDVGLTVEQFNSNKKLKPFVPVATYDFSDAQSRHQEFVSVLEGTYMPFFGIASRIDKIQFGFHAHPGTRQFEHVDHSRFAVEHAQHIANLIVDEARLSDNRYEWTNDEQAALLNNHDYRSVSLPTPDFGADPLQFYRSELYLF